jgi:hypothetical protein
VGGMIFLKRHAFQVLLVVVLGCVAVGRMAGAVLFNGKDLAGWETWLAAPLPASVLPGAERDEKGNYVKALGLNNDPLRVFTVEEVDGKPAIHVSGEGFGTLTTLESFSNYHLKVQFKWGQKKFGAANRPRNGGLLYHAQGNHGDVGGRWMASHQFQIEEGGVGDYIGVGPVVATAQSAALPDKRRIFSPVGEAFDFKGNVKEASKCLRQAGTEATGAEWNTLELYCVGDEIVQVLNGAVTVRLTRSRTEAGAPLTAGRVCLQIEAAEIYFRGFEVEAITALPEKL